MHPNLAVRSVFSIGESILSIDDIIKEAKDVGATSIGLTDTMSVTGMIEFSIAAKKAGIKPIIGCRLRLVDDATWRRPKGVKEKMPADYYITAYAKSEKGIQALFRLLTKANSEENFYYFAKLSFDDLFAELEHLTADDLIIASDCEHSVIRHKDAVSLLDRMKRSVSVFISLVPVDTPYFDRINAMGMQIATKLDLPFLALRPVRYPKAKADANDVMGAICSNSQIDSPFFLSPHQRDMHIIGLKEFTGEARKAIDRMKNRYGIASPNAAFRQAIENTARLVDSVEYVWERSPVSLPKMAPDEYKALVDECRKGVKERLTRPIFGFQPTVEQIRDVYMPRLKYELSVLKKMNFSGYFLLVQDLVLHAKKNDIMVGPGRGSVGGSLVAYLMGITECDPLRFGLLFERFINPDRIDLPDADLDFMSERRHEVVEYLTEKYGSDRVAGISNFSKLGSPSALRGVGKAFGFPSKVYDCSKYVPKIHGSPVSLATALTEVPEIEHFKKEVGNDIWDICLDLEGALRGLSQHAAGVVVAGCDLTDRAVITSPKATKIVNWDKRTVEDQGLVKIDILGVNTLDLINLTCKFIEKSCGKKIDLSGIPLDDEAVLENFANGKTVGVFQFESGGMRRLLKELGKDNKITFDDVSAATALYRPGPMDSGMMESYYKRKQGLEDVEYDHENMREVLEPTFGVMVYQEQVMQVSRDLAGYSMADADKLRKIMGKKDPEKMALERDIFVNGCINHSGTTKELAEHIFENIVTFAGYGFNKSHSVEYTLISWQSMWLKTHYPIEFFAAAFSLASDEKLPALLKDAANMGIHLVTPDINKATENFEIIDDKTLMISLMRVKGLSSNTAQAIVQARGDKLFASFEDFCERIEKRRCNVRHQDILRKIGAFASIEPGSLPSTHKDRIMDQRELIPGLISSIVPVPLHMKKDKLTKAAIVEVINDYREKFGPGPGVMDGMPVSPAMGRDPKFMVIFDAPNSKEEQVGKMTFTDNFNYVAEALDDAGLTRNDAYWTALIKRTKEGKQVSPHEIEAYIPYLMREIQILKPPLIVLLGGQTVRHFFPGTKGKASESAGQIVYNTELKTNIITGFNPGEIYFDREKQAVLNDLFNQVTKIIE